MQINRRSWLRFLPAALVPVAMRAQSVASRVCMDIKTQGFIPCPPESTPPVTYPGWTKGKAINNQCPQCGTMAAPLPQHGPFRNCRASTPIENTTSGQVCIEADMNKNQLVRCLRCNNAFFQDAE